MQIANIRVDEVVPHRGAMLLLERLLAHDEESIAVEAVVREDNAFADAEGVPIWVGIEYMAQTIAAWAGCRARQLNEPVKLGFLLGTRRFECAGGHFQFGQRLRVEARREFSADNGMGMFACRILVGAVEVATANVLVYEPTDIDEFLKEVAR